MANQLYIHPSNPVKFVPINPVTLPQYLTKHFETFLFIEQIYPWQQRTGYCQKWQKSDTIKLQFTSDIETLKVSIVDENDVPFAEYAMVKKLEDRKNPGLFAREVSIPLAAIAERGYCLKVSAGTTPLYISEPQSIKQFHENTLLLEYNNSRYHQDIIFETGIVFTLRVEGAFGFLNPASSDQYYTNQRFTPVVLSSKPYRNFPLSFGGTYGIPDWLIDKINLAFTCNSVTIDGKAFSKISDTKFSFSEEDDYPLRGLSFEVREKNTAVSSQIKLFTAYWRWTTSITGLKFLIQSSGDNPNLYQKKGLFQSGANIIADFAGAPRDRYLIIRVPADQPLFTIWENDPFFNYGTIGDYVFQFSYLDFNSQFRYYVTRRTVTMNPNFPVILKR